MFQKLIDSSVIISILESLKFDQKQSLKNLIECYECMEREEKGKKVFDFPNKYFLMHGDSRDTSGLRQQELYVCCLCVCVYQHNVCWFSHHNFCCLLILPA